MNIGSGQPIGHDPLTPEERELAQRLSQLGPSTGPHSNVDAHILAAAHDAVAQPRAHARARRWPVALGVAASLAFAVGIAWRLRPLPEPPPSPVESTAATAAIADVADAAAARMQEQATQDRPIAEAAKEHADAESASAQAARAVAAPEAPAPARAAEPLDEASDRARAYAPAMAPPPAPPPSTTATGAAHAEHDPAASLMAPPEAVERLRRLEATQPQVAGNKAAANAPTPGAHPSPKAAEATDALPAAAAAPAPASARHTTSASESNADDIEFTDADNGDEPPAYASSPQVREAWLQRIRELLAEGKSEDALDSLDEFQRRYPQYPLPDDLRQLKHAAPEPPAP